VFFCFYQRVFKRDKNVFGCFLKKQNIIAGSSPTIPCTSVAYGHLWNDLHWKQIGLWAPVENTTSFISRMRSVLGFGFFHLQTDSLLRKDFKSRNCFYKDRLVLHSYFKTKS
jgi:hypothetical protein